jgi:hypothetical protein
MRQRFRMPTKSGCSLLALLSLFFGWTLRHDAAAEVSGHRSKLPEA